MKVKILGREPAAIVGLVEAVLVMLLSFGLWDLSQETVGLIMAVVTSGFGLYSAYVTKDTLLGAVIGFMKAGLTLAAVYGLTLSDNQTGTLIAVITMSFGLFYRSQTSPAAVPSFTEGVKAPAAPVAKKAAAKVAAKKAAKVEGD